MDLRWGAHALGQLLAQGHSADPSAQLQPLLTGHAHATSSGWVLGQALLQERELLASDAELVMALLAQLPALRGPWLRIAAARCLEAGKMADGESLLNAVTQLGPAAAWAEAALPDAALAPTQTSALERELLGAGAEQAAVLPALLRVLASAHRLAARSQAALPSLPAVDASGALSAQNWVAGRMLALPQAAAHEQFMLQGAGERAPAPPAAVPLSTGIGEPFSTQEPAPNSGLGTLPTGAAWPDGEARMRWLMANPWAFLLAMVVYAQDAWAAECRGGLLLELPDGQQPHSPFAIDVLVQGIDGSELACGTLADLVLRTLAQLGMGSFPVRPSPEALNAQLSPLVGMLLARQVWRYVDAPSGARGQYQIHPDFADAAYRTLGSKVIRRGAGPLWQAVRMQAEAMRAEALAKAGGLSRTNRE